MNIFALSRCAQTSAEWLCDKHVVKMILETGQMLSTAHHVLESEHLGKYKYYEPAYVNHPCTVWARTSHANYMWLYEHFERLCQLYEEIYNRTHKTWVKLHIACRMSPFKLTGKFKTPNSDVLDLTEFPQCMPDQYKDTDPHVAYRRYYIGEKLHFAEYKSRKIPAWIASKDVYLDN